MKASVIATSSPISVNPSISARPDARDANLGTADTVRPTLLRFAVATFACFVVMNVAGAAIAVAMGPLVQPIFGSLMRDPKGDGLLMATLLPGYLVIAMALSFLYPRFQGAGTLRSGLLLGALVGVPVFFGGHLVISGWSRMPAGVMAFAGALDALAVVLGGLATAMVYRFRAGKRAA